MVTQGGGLVEHLCAFALGLLQQVGGIKVLAVERRVFAHDHRVHTVQGQMLVHTLHLKPCIGLAGEVNALGPRGDLVPTLPHDVVWLTGQHVVATLLCFAHHGKGGVFVECDRHQWCICANSFSRHCDMPEPMVGTMLSRDKK